MSSGVSGRYYLLKLLILMPTLHRSPAGLPVGLLWRVDTSPTAGISHKPERLSATVLRLISLHIFSIKLAGGRCRLRGQGPLEQGCAIFQLPWCPDNREIAGPVA